MTDAYTSLNSADHDKAPSPEALPTDKALEYAAPGTMKAVVFTKFGDVKDVLNEIRMPIPKITKDNQVLVKVLYAGLNSVDYKMINGKFGLVSPRRPKSVPGCDFCGRVEAKGKGSNVRFLDVGDLVFGEVFEGNGTFAEYTVCNASSLCKVPSTVDPVEVAAIPVVAGTAFQAMEALKVKPQTKLLILGGGTSVGRMAIQIAKNHIGCGEVAVTSSREALCMELGANSVVNYKEEKWTEVYKDHGFDAIFDCVGGVESWDLSKSEGVLKEDGRYLTIVGDEENGAHIDFGAILRMTGKMINRNFWSVLGEPSWDFMVHDSSKNIDDVAALIRDQKIKPMLDEESPFQFADWAKMFEKLQSQQGSGRLVVKVAEDEEEDEHGQENKDNMESATVSKEVVEEDIKMDEEPVIAAAPAENVEEEVVAEDDAKEEDDVKVDEVVAADTAPADDAADDGAEEAADDGAGADDANVEPEAAADEVKEEEQEVVAEDNAETAAVDDENKPDDKADVAAGDEAVDDESPKEDEAPKVSEAPKEDGAEALKNE